MSLAEEELDTVGDEDSLLEGETLLLFSGGGASAGGSDEGTKGTQRTSLPPVMRKTYPLNSSPRASAATSWAMRFS